MFNGYCFSGFLYYKAFKYKYAIENLNYNKIFRNYWRTFGVK